MGERICDHIRSNVVGYVAMFLVLSGGTALATHPGGANTISSDDIINKEIRTADIRDNNVQTPNLGPNAVTSPKIADGEVRSVDVLDNSLTPADIADVGFLQADTARLVDNQAGGSSAGQTLFTIGRVGLNAFCSNNGGGSFTAGISPRTADDDTEDPRPVMVTDGDAGAADDDVELVPFDVQFFALVTDTVVAAQEVSFAILDNESTSASGVAAVSVDPANKRCVITAQATG